MNLNSTTHNNPFFSVCLDITNREKTLTKVLTNLLEQSCRDFEVIMIDHNSIDKSYEIAKIFSYEFKDVTLKLIQESTKVNEISQWNSPLKYATGTYIAVCEGDDYFEHDHLETAKQMLQSFENIGIYEVPNGLKNFEESYLNVLDSNTALKELLILSLCPVPSCAIFIRCNEKGAPYMYDESYVYSAEPSLYLQILKDEFSVIQNYTKTFVTRDLNPYFRGYFHIKDSLKFRSINLNLYSKQQLEILDGDLIKQAVHMLLSSFLIKKIDANLIRVLLIGNFEILTRTKIITRETIIFIFNLLKPRLVNKIKHLKNFI